jgi:branched-subunit amino acid aminotransferase/4-amino-4-deoxychorismate lyase
MIEICASQGVYTTLRTINNGIFDLQSHLSRFSSIKGFSETFARQKIREEIKKFHLSNGSDFDLKITLTVFPTIDQALFPDYTVNVERLNVDYGVSIQVEVAGSSNIHRFNPHIKNVAWLEKRKDIIKQHPETHEIILHDTFHNLYEGTSSNFFIIMNNSVFSCPLELILIGTILKIVKRLCEKHNIPFVEEYPSCKDVGRWEGAFITSTSRTVLPVTKIITCFGTFDIPSLKSSLVDFFRSEVKHEMFKNVTLLSAL